MFCTVRALLIQVPNIEDVARWLGRTTVRVATGYIEHSTTGEVKEFGTQANEPLTLETMPRAKLWKVSEPI